MHWISRAILAVGLGGFIGGGLGLVAVLSAATGSRAVSLPSTSYWWFDAWAPCFLVLPAACLTMLVYGITTAVFCPRPVSNETRCRKCQYILRGIPEPRCPECGERI